MDTLVRKNTAATETRHDRRSTNSGADLVTFAFAMTVIFVAAIAMTFVGIATSSLVILGGATAISIIAAFAGVYGTANLLNR